MPSTEFLNRPGSVWERTSFEGKQFPQIRAEMEQLAIAGLRSYEDVSWEPGTCGTISGKWVRPKRPAAACSITSTAAALPLAPQPFHCLSCWK